jgi:metal-sulfur cluster biosynthetic enzyme
LAKVAYFGAMDSDMTCKIEAILNRVKEPESQLTIAQLGLVKKIRYNKISKKLSVFISAIGPSKGCCTVIGTLLLSTTLENLTQEFKKEFPDLAVEMI